MSDIPPVAYDAITPAELRNRRTMKWSVAGDDLIPAWVAEMDFPLAPVIRDALTEAIARGETGYPPQHEAAGLPEACAAWLSRSFGLTVEPAQVQMLPDVVRGIEMSIQIYTRSESPIIVPTPSYPPFFEAVRGSGRTTVEVPMASDEEGSAHFDLELIDAAFHAGAGAIILCNPHNPSGRVFDREELRALSHVVEHHRARVIADEIHAPLVYPGGTHVPYATVSDDAATHSVTLTSASKGWNIPGLKCAQIILTNPADLEIWLRLPFVRTHGTGTLGIVANRVAFENGKAWLEETVAYLDGNRRLLADLLGRCLPEVGYRPPEGTYLAWLDCAPLGIGDPAGFFREHARVGLSAGHAFGAPGAHHVRLNFATSRTILAEIVERMARAVGRTAE